MAFHPSRNDVAMRLRQALRFSSNPPLFSGGPNPWNCAIQGLAFFMVLLATSRLPGQTKTLDVTFKTDEGNVSSLGEVLVEYADGSMLLLTPDGQLWTLHHDEIVSQQEVDEAMVPLTSEEIYQQFKSRLPRGVQLHKTRHYVLLHNTSDVYARWVAQLFERLHRGFYNYWKSQRIKLEEPRFPLVALVFRDKASYLQFAEREVGKSASAMIGYYNLKTNRMVTYDLTGIGNALPSGARLPTSQDINRILARPEAERTVATIVHEAVHQISYNSGLQVRLADNPKWLSEGMATFFESPDLKSRAGWAMGQVNYHNLALFRQYLRTRPADSLTTLLCNDVRFDSGATAGQAYAESWAFTYFLMKTKRKEYSAYLQELAAYPPLGETTARERIDLIKKYFGDDLQALDTKFIKYMRAIR